jgi:hypothetical protein
MEDFTRAYYLSCRDILCFKAPMERGVRSLKKGVEISD